MFSRSPTTSAASRWPRIPRPAPRRFGVLLIRSIEGGVGMGEVLVLARVRALVATGVLALSCGLTGTSVASETDTGQEGSSSQPDAPGDEVGGGSQPDTPLPVPVQPVYGDPDQDAPVEQPAGGEPASGLPLEVVAPAGVVPVEPEEVGSPSAPTGMEPSPTEPVAGQPVAGEPVAPSPLSPPSPPQAISGPAPLDRADSSERALVVGS